MLVYTENTEQMFTNALASCETEEKSHRFIVLKFSEWEEKPRGWRKGVMDAVKKTIEDDNSQVFVFDDDDLCVLTRSVLNKGLEQLVENIKPVFAQNTPVKDIASLYELPVDTNTVSGFCQIKIERKKMAQQKQTKAAQAKEQKKLENTLNGPVDLMLVDSIGARRAERSDPEVLVVEDDLFSQRLVRNALSKDYKISSAPDARGAILQYSRTAPDILFLDIGLPDASGHLVLKKIFELDPDAYVVMLSGKGDRDNIMKAMTLGAKGFVGKPFSKNKLLQYIEKSPFIQAKQKLETQNEHNLH